MKRLLFGLSLFVMVALVLTGCGTGEATKFDTKKLVDPKAQIDPSVLKAALQEAKFICEDYLMPEADKTLNGYQFCQKQNLKACSVVIKRINTQFYDSKNGMCSGKVQMILPDMSYAMPCEARLDINPSAEKLGFGCQNNPTFNNVSVEPGYGDIKFSEQTTQVVCCGFD